MATRDPWLAERSGLPDDFACTIERSYFGFDARYQGGQQLLLIWEISSDDPEVGEQRIVWSCGNGWSSPDGKVAVHERGYEEFVKTSTIRRLVNRIFAENVPELKGAAEVLRQRDNELGPRNAKVWEGLRFHMRRETLEFGKGLEPQERLMPVKFLGVAGEKAKGKGAPAAKGEAPGKETPKPAEEEPKPADKTAKILKGKLIKLAKECETQDEFVSKALDIEGVTDDDELYADVMDESEEGFWHRYHK